ncbi:MAG: ATP-binding cassette domain-containing protein [bacterium]|nr:ATP-binding cassette domain-containing protein [Acidimicrobiia bacterium]MCY4648819.1 ATP-binding cassette domain-containing protein [bacterium]
MRVSLRYPPGDPVLDLDGLELVAGRRTVVFGPNGSGKTTLLRLLAGTVEGGPQWDAAYLPQTPHLFRGGVGWNLGLGLDTEQAVYAARLAERLGMGNRFSEAVGPLSGGERQRIALARVLASPGRWILLDEPLAPIDAEDRVEVARVIAEAVGDRGAVIVTHDLETAAALGSHMAVLVGGRLRQQGPLGEVLSRPVDPRVASVVGVSNLWEGVGLTRSAGFARVQVGSIRIWGVGAVGAGNPCRALFRGESVAVLRTGGSAGSLRNRWRGSIAEVRRGGRWVELTVDLGSAHVTAVITPGAMDELELEVGSEVVAAVKASAVRLLNAG